MPRAEIYLEDAEDGAGVEVKFAFLGGFDQRSGAHLAANEIRAHLDVRLKLERESQMQTVRENPLADAS